MAPADDAARISRPDPTRVPDEAELYDRHFEDVARWARRLGGPTVDADDVVHDVFIVAFAQLGSFRHDAKITTWLFRITERVVYTHRHRGRWRRWLAGLPQQYAEQTSHPGRTPPEELEARQAAVELYAALDALDEVHRTTFVLFEMEELRAEEVATLLGTTVSTVWVRVHRARKRMETYLVRRRGRRNGGTA